MHIFSWRENLLSRRASRAAFSLTCCAALSVPPSLAAAQNVEDPVVQELAIESYAGKHHVSDGEALRRIHIQDRASGIEDRIEQLLGEQFAGLWYDHDDQGRLHVGMTRDAGRHAAEVQALIDEYRLGSDARLVSVQYSLGELESLQGIVRESLRDMMRSGHATTGPGEKLNRVVVQALEVLPPDEEARIAALERMEGVTVRRVQAASLLVTPLACAVSACDPPLRGGRSMYACTAGFMARHHVNTDHLLVLTAGHCINEHEYWTARDENYGLLWRRIGTDYGGIFGGSLGIDAGVIFIEPWEFWGSSPAPQVVVKHSAKTAYNPNYAIRSDARSTEGQTLCWTGGKSGSWCAEVSELGWDHTMSDGTFLKNLGVLDSCAAVKGDSGGPIFKNNRAFGLLIGRGDCHLVYQGVRGAQKALNVDLLLTP